MLTRQTVERNLRDYNAQLEDWQANYNRAVGALDYLKKNGAEKETIEEYGVKSEKAKMKIFQITGAIQAEQNHIEAIDKGSANLQLENILRRKDDNTD